MSSNFIPSTDARALSERCAASLRANGELMAMILQDMPVDKHESLNQLLAGGGRIGIETLIDGKGANTISLIAIEREGARLVLSTISAQQKK